MMAVVCVDAGTTMIKAVGYDAGGAETVIARRPATVSRPRPGWAEQDMHAVWAAVAACVREVLAALDGPVDYVAVTGQGDGSWLVGADGEPTGPAVLWNDGRGAAHVDRWTREGVLSRAFAVNGSLSFAGQPSAILAWMREHDPARLERSAATLTCGGWIFARLTGVLAAEGSDAAAPFGELATARYAPELLDLYGMRWAERLLPELRDDDHRSAPLTGTAAAELGLPAGTPVVMAPYDVAATAVGMGVTEPGQACAILGTTLCTEVVTDVAAPEGDASGTTLPLGLPYRLLRVFPTLAGGEVITWACAMLGLRDPAELGRLALRAPAGADGLVLLPYLSPAGSARRSWTPARGGRCTG
ncbi:FGGY family carbohydrate kinase [Nonomuraea sp. NBC_01738]|uniref:FGGY family carbohydrate kinase n=1 Tax=Nonomuraea sp. NBC_01738 TaxID=2976003 RepID=UPI002E111B6E|nr:FGGY family carbohydrate kinase [Nonomuraea sp. NBC_01738]